MEPGRREGRNSEIGELSELGDDAGAGLAVAVRVDGLAHRLIGGSVIEKGRDFTNDLGVVRADELDRSGLEGFRTLGGITHHKYGLAEAGGFLLDAPESVRTTVLSSIK